MKRGWLLGIVFFALMGWGFGEEEHPFKKAKVGDWVEYAVQTETMGMKMPTKVKQTIKAKDEKEVTLAMDTEVMGMKNSSEIKIRLDQPYDPMQAPPGSKIEKLAEGDEEITVAGKSYKCHWIHAKFTAATEEGMSISGTAKTWSCPSVPLGGMVKMENESNTKQGPMDMKTTMLMELAGSGSAP